MYRESTPDPLIVVVEGSRVRALLVRSGEAAWDVQLTESGGPPALQVVAGRVYVLYSDSLSCLALVDGAGLWKTKLTATQGDAVRASLLIHERHAYASVGRELHCIGLDKGDLRWTHEGDALDFTLRSFGFEGAAAQADVVHPSSLQHRVF